jgi:hypothetical protein
MIGASVGYIYMCACVCRHTLRKGCICLSLLKSDALCLLSLARAVLVCARLVTRINAHAAIKH